MVYYIDFHVLNQHYIHPINLTWSSCMCCAVLSHSVVPNFVQPHGLWPVQLIGPWGFSRQEYWNGLPCPPPVYLPNPRIKPRSPVLQVDSLPSEPPILILFFHHLRSVVPVPSGLSGFWCEIHVTLFSSYVEDIVSLLLLLRLFSRPLVFRSLTVVYLDVDFFGLILFRIHSTSSICRFMSFATQKIFSHFFLWILSSPTFFLLSSSTPMRKISTLLLYAHRSPRLCLFFPSLIWVPATCCDQPCMVRGLNVVLFSKALQCYLVWILSHYSLLQDMEYSSPCS